MEEKAKETTTPEAKEAPAPETSDSVIVDLNVKDEPEVEESPEEETAKPETEAKEEEPEPQQDRQIRQEPTGKYDFEGLLEQAKEDLRKELKADKKESYTEEQLTAAEDEADRQLDNGEITPAQHRKYIRQITGIRDRQTKDRFKVEWEAERGRRDAERNVLGWAKENAPQFLDRRSKESRDAEDFGVNVLGGQRQGDSWVFGDKVTQVMLGILYQATTGRDKDKVKEAEQRGFERGAKAKEVRRNDLKGAEPPASASKTKHDEPITDREREVMEKLGIKNIKLYRKFKGLSPKRGSTIEVST